METSHPPLSSESFSFKWVINLNSSFDGLGESFRAALEASDEAAFIDIDLKMSNTLSRRFHKDVEDFKFPTYDDTSSMFVYADEVSSNGHISPFISEEDPCRLTSSKSCRFVVPLTSKVGCSSLRRCWKSFRRILKKHISCFKPSSYSIRDSDHIGTGAETHDACVHVWEEASGRRSTECLIHNWSDIEKSIQEAVLHCRMSFEK